MHNISFLRRKKASESMFFFFLEHNLLGNSSGVFSSSKIHLFLAVPHMSPNPVCGKTHSHNILMLISHVINSQSSVKISNLH